MSRSGQSKLVFPTGRDPLCPEHPATDKWRARLIELLEPYRAAATALLRQRACLLPNEELEDLPLRHFPKTKLEMDKLLKDAIELEILSDNVS